MKPSVFGKKVQGASHIRSDVECQDWYDDLPCDDGTIIMAVADGHGSKKSPYSKTGAHIAVNVFCDIMNKYVTEYADDSGNLLTYLNREGDTKIAQAIETEWKKRVYKNHRKNKRDVTLDENGVVIREQVYPMYGTTLLGLVLTKDFVFAFQIGDGDIVFISEDGLEPVIKGDKILGVETHSLSKKYAWKNAITIVRRMDFQEKLPSMFLMSTDGFANSFKNNDEFSKTCIEYFNMVNQHGTKAVDENLERWLSETSAMGSGDDITVVMAYYGTDGDEDHSNESDSEDACLEEDLTNEITETPISIEDASTDPVADNKMKSEVTPSE